MWLSDQNLKLWLQLSDTTNNLKVFSRAEEIDESATILMIDL